MENSNIERFWKSFEEHQTLAPNELVLILNEQIKAYDPGLFVELNSSTMPKVLTITPKGMKVHFGQAYATVALAPSVEGWIFRAGKAPLDEVVDEGITFMPLESSDFPDDLAIRVYHKDYVSKEGEEQNRIVAKLYATLDALLGEESATFDFQYIDFDDMPHPKEKDYPLAVLPNYIQNKKAQRFVTGQRFPKEEIELLEGKVETLPTLLALNHGLKYYTFTKDFPYLLRLKLALKNVGENQLPTGNTDELYRLEDTFYGAIYKQAKGHFIATETHNAQREIFYYVDSLESIESALALVPPTLETCTFSYEVNFDPFWVMVESYIYM